MQDLNAAPRWSKTTVVVVLVVFGLVLIVTVAALWGFGSYRERVRQDDRARADAEARRELESIQRGVDRRLEGLLARAARDSGPEHLRALRDSKTHGPLLREMFFLDADESLRWVDPAYRLYVMPARIEAASELQALHDEERRAFHQQAVEKGRDEGPAAALPLWRALAEDWGLLATREPGSAARFAWGLAFGTSMLDAAWRVANAQPEALEPADVRAVLLRAVELESLWQDRSAVDKLDLRLGELRRGIDKLLGALSGAQREALEWEIKRVRYYRELVADPHLRVTLASAVRKLGRTQGRHVVFENPELLGVSRLPEEHAHTLVARLDRDAVAALITENVNQARFSALGGRAAVFPLDQPPALDGQSETRLLALDDRPIELPYRLAFFRTGDPLGNPTGATDLLLWVLVGLAVAGLGVGGYVLVRLLTREIRVARLKADFVSNISHELKTPITSISLFTEMLDEGKISDPAEQAEAFSVLAQESLRLQRIVARMLTVARGEARRNPYVLAPGDLNSVVREAVERFQRITTEPGLQLETALFPGALPVQMDSQAMDDVVTNLLSNAWKYKRGDRVRITVRTARRGRQAELVVSDDGVGIPREERRRVFEMFYRSNQLLTDQVAGTGLGLALVRAAVREHQGTVRIEAGEGGRGAAFRLRFPLDMIGVAAEAVADRAAPPISPPAHAGPRGTLGGAGPSGPARSPATRPGAQP